MQGFSVLVVIGATLLLASGAVSAPNHPRVLDIRFGPDLEINPLTQDYFTHQLSSAASHGRVAPMTTRTEKPCTRRPLTS